MAASYAFVGPAYVDGTLAIPVLSAAVPFVLVDTSSTANENVAVYKSLTTDAAAQVTVTARRRYDPKQNMTFNSIRLTGAIAITGTVDEDGYEPAEALIAWNHSGRYVAVPMNMQAAIEATMAIFLQGDSIWTTCSTVTQFNHDVVSALDVVG